MEGNKKSSMQNLLNGFKTIVSKNPELEERDQFSSDIDDEVGFWMEIPNYLNKDAKIVTDEDNLETYWYSFGWHPDNETVFLGICGDSEQEYYSDDELLGEVADWIRKVCGQYYYNHKS